MKARVRSIQWWLLARELPLLLLIFAGILYWMGRELTEVLYSANLEIAKRSAMAVVYGVQASMVTQDRHRVWDRVVDKIPRHEQTRIDILNTEGEVLFSTDPAGRRPLPKLSDPACVACHVNGDLKPTLQATILQDPADQDYQIFAAPLLNTEECRWCHHQKGQKLGLVLVRRSLEPVHEQVRAAQIALAIVGGTALLSTLLTTRLLLGRYLGRPIKRLVAGARAIGAGNLEHAIELPEPTELALLADTLNTSTARLSKMQRELIEAERLAAVGETVAGLSHSLKSMLNGLRAGQYVIDRAMETRDTEKLRTGWRVMKNSIRRVERLVFDMLHFVKDRIPERQPANINGLILEAVDALKEMSVGRGVEIRAELDEEMSEVLLDPTAIYRLIIDLGTNAIDACTESESGNLVNFRSRAKPDEIVLTVEDNGIGMSEEVLENLFARLFSTKAAKGTGLGLAVVKKITEEHGGTVTVESVPGKGSAFHVHLPRRSRTRP